MHHFLYKTFVTLLSLKHKNILVCMLVFSAIILTACSSTSVSTPAAQATTPPTVLATPTPTQKPTPVPTQRPKPTHEATKPYGKPQPTAAPTLAPQPASAPAVLDLQPASMSIVGHLDCQKTANFTCLARVLSRPGNQSDLHWDAYTNVPGGIVFRPVSGVLTPGQSVLVTIIVPSNACTPGLFFFRGPINTHTITWAC